MHPIHPQCRSLIVPADLGRVSEVRDFADVMAEEAGFPESRRFDVKLVTSEATANAIEHAEEAGEVRVEIELYSDRLEVRILGRGEFRLPGIVSERQHRGLGLPLMATLSDHLALYSRPDGGTMVALTFYLPGHPVPAAQARIPLPPGLIEVLTESDLLDEVLDSMPAIFAVFDEEWRFRYLNRTGELFAGVPRDELLGKVLWEADPAATALSMRREYLEAVRTGRPREWTEFLEHVGRWIEQRAIPISGGLALVAEDVTEAKRAEAELRESDRRFRLALANAPVTVATLDAELRYTWAFNTRHGFRPETIVGKRADELIGPDQASEVVALQRQALAEGRPIRREVRGHTEGREWVYDAVAEPLWDDDGRVTGLGYVAVEVTQRKLAEEAAYRSRARFELLTETASDLLACDEPQEVVEALCRRVLDFLDCQAFFNYLVAPSQDRLTLNAYAGIPPEVAREIEWLEYGQAVCGCAAQTGARIIAEHILESRDPLTDLVRSFGIRAYVAHPLRAAGTVIGTLSFGTTTRDEFRDDELGLMSAVADQVALAMERSLSKRVLLEREEQFRATFEQVAVGMAHISFDGRFLRTNEKFASIVGYPPEELARLSFAEVTHAADREKDLRLTDRLRRREISSYTIEKRYVRKDGSAVWCSMTASLVGDPRSDDSYFVAVVEDISARKAAEVERDGLLAAVHDASAELAAANRELQRQNEALALRQDELRRQTRLAEEARQIAEERSRLARALNDLNQAITSSHSLEDVMRQVVRVAATAFPADAAVIEVPAADGWRIAFAHGLAAEVIGRAFTGNDVPVASLVAGLNEPMIVGDARTDARLSGSILVQTGLRSLVAVPLRVREQVFGVLVLVNREVVGAYSAARVDFVRKLGSSISLGLENSRLLAWLQEEVASLAVLRDVAGAAASSLELPLVAGQVLEAAREHLGARAGAAYMLDEPGRRLHHLASFGWGGLARAASADLPYDDESAVGFTLRSGIAQLTHDATLPPLGGPLMATVTEDDRWIVLPIRVARRRMGALLLVFGGRRPFTAAESALFSSIAEALGVASENARLYQAQRSIADTLQADVLAVPSRLPGIEVAHVYRSATEAARVGGDFYDVFSPEEGKVAFLIGDVCGFGVRAATQASLVRDTLRAYLFGGFSLERVMTLANKVLGRQTSFQGFTTVFLGLLDVDRGDLAFCTAGHPPGVLRRRSGQTVPLSTGSPPLGAFPDSEYRTAAEVLTPGELLLLYTDGLLEARRDGELFGEERVDAVVRRNHDGVRRLTRELLREVTEFTGGDLRDDLAVLALTLDAREAPTDPRPGLSS